jgi:ankyrin repeat protein
MLFSESKPQYVEELLQNKLPPLEKKELNQVGIIQSTNNYIGFIHRTFAEYFAVDLLASWLKRPDKYHKHPQEQELLLTQILIKPDYEIIRLFFNYKLKKIKLKPNTLTLYGTQIAKLWLDEPNRFRNEHEQTALHVASKESNTEIIDFLLNSFKGHYDTLKTLVVANDKYQKTALHLAVLENNSKALEQLLQGINNNSLETLKDLYLLDGGNTTVLHYAANKAYLKCVKLLVEYNPYNIDIRDINGNTPLGIAAKAGFFGLQEEYNEVIKFLIKRGANPNIRDNVGFTPLNDAAYSNNLQCVEILLDNGATPNPDFKESDIGVTPLHSAVLSGNLRIVELLLEKGGKPYFKSGKGGFLGKFHLTALHLAALLPSCVTDRLEIIKSLLKKDKSIINTEFKAHAGDFKAFIKTIIDFAKLFDFVKKCHTWFKKGLQDNLILTISKFDSSITLTAYDIAENLDEKETLTLLKDAGATKATSNTFIFLITSRITFKVLKDYVIPEIQKSVWDKQLILRDDELAHQDWTAVADQREQNILHMAVLNGDLGTVENQLNSFKNDPKTLQHLIVVTDGSGQTALHLAADRGFDEIVKQILASAKSIPDDSKTLSDLVMITTYNSKKTALHLAAWNGYNEVVKRLLESIEKYPDTLKQLVSAVDRDGRIPLHEAAASGSLSVVKELLASIEKYPDTTQLVSAVDRNGRTLLHEAAESDSLDVVKELLARVEKYPNTLKQLASAVDKDGRTPLHKAAASGSLNVVKELLASVKKYPDTLKQLVSAVDKDGRTLLHEAAESGSLDVVRGLLASVKMYFDTLQLVSAVDKDHRTPLHEAAKSGSLGVVKELLASVEKYLDTLQLVSAVDKDHRTPLHEAAKSGSMDVVKELLESVEKYPDTFKKLVSAVDRDNSIPLHEAAASGSLGAVKELLASIEKYPDTLQLVSAVNKDGRTPLHEAAESGSLEVVRLLEEKYFRFLE